MANISVITITLLKSSVQLMFECAFKLGALTKALSPTQELEAIKARVREMEEEAEKLKELQNEVEKQMNLSPPPGVNHLNHESNPNTVLQILMFLEQDSALQFYIVCYSRT